MTVVLYRLRVELRAHWGSWLALALVVGVGCGLVVAGVAGANRAGSVATRLARATDRSDAFVDSGYFYGHSNVHSGRIAKLPQVVAAGRRDMLVVDGRTRSGAVVWPDESADTLTIYEPVGSVESRLQDRPVVVAGRRPDPGHPDEVMLDRDASRILGYGVGDSFQLRFATTRFVHRLDSHRPAIGFAFRHNPLTYPSGPLVRLHVVGVATSLDSPGVWLSPGFFRAHDNGRLQAWVREDSFALRGDATGIPGFRSGIGAIAGDSGFDFINSSDGIAAAQATVDLETRTVWAVTIVGALAMLALTTMLLLRESGRESRDWQVMRALGIRQRQAALLGAGRGLLVGLIAAATAMAVATVLSPLFPLGRAHALEPAPGVAVDPVVILVGVVAIVVVCTIAAALANWQIAVHAAQPEGRSPVPGFGETRFARLPLTAAVGLRAIADRGAARASITTTALAMTVAVTVVAAAIVVTSSFAHLLATPSLYGQNWDLEIGEGGAPQPQEVAFLHSSPVVDAFAEGATATTLQIDGQQTGVQAMGGGRGRVTPTVVSGRAPHAANDILLAPRTLASLHADIGSWVTARRGRRSDRMLVVGEGVLPPSDTNGLGDGAAVTLQGLKRLYPRTFASVFRVRLTPGMDSRLALSAINRGPMVVFPPVTPETVADSARGRSMLDLVAAIAATVAMVALVHTLITVVRDRRRELAILKTVGFVRSQLLMSVIWQGVAMALVALAIGLPLGIAVGRWVWTLITEDLGVLKVTVTPAPPLLAVIPAVLLVVIATAAAPGRSAARTRAAQALRVE